MSLPPQLTNVRGRPCFQCNKKSPFFSNLHPCRRCTISLSPPPTAPVSFHRHNEALQNCLHIPRVFYFSPLSPAAERHSPSEPSFVTLPEFHFDIPRVLNAPFAFYSSFDTLLTPPAPSSVRSPADRPQMKAAVSLHSGDGLEKLFLLVTAVREESSAPGQTRCKGSFVEEPL